MNNLLFPAYAAASIDELDGAFFSSRGIRAVLLDIDNTLVLPHTDVPDERADRLIDSLLSAGLSVCLISNNKRKRVERFNTHGLIATHRSAKPLPFAFTHVRKKLGLPKSAVAVVGDQIYSDVLGGNLAGAYTVYVPPIAIGGEGAFVFLKRRWERPVLKEIDRLYRKNV